MASVAISAETADLLERMANRQAVPAQDLADRAIRQFLRDEARRLMEREIEAFRLMHSQLLTKYGNQFVAVFQRKVVDHDIDQDALLKRIESNYPDLTVLITQVLSEPVETYTIRSPRVDDNA